MVGLLEHMKKCSGICSGPIEKKHGAEEVFFCLIPTETCVVYKKKLKQTWEPTDLADSGPIPI
jgi:hypothetical protein